MVQEIFTLDVSYICAFTMAGHFYDPDVTCGTKKTKKTRTIDAASICGCWVYSYIACSTIVHIRTTVKQGKFIFLSTLFPLLLSFNIYLCVQYKVHIIKIMSPEFNILSCISWTQILYLFAWICRRFISLDIAR